MDCWKGTLYKVDRISKSPIKQIFARERPCSGSHKKMFDYVGVGFRLDVDGAEKWLQEQSQTFYRDVLLYQLDYARDILQNERMV